MVMFDRIRKFLRIRKKAVEPVTSPPLPSFAWPGLTINQGVAEPTNDLTYTDMFDIAYQVTELRTIHNNLKNEIWRIDPEVIAVEGDDMDPDEKARASKYLKSANEFDQPLKSILETTTLHTLITDDPWLWVRKNYQYDGSALIPAGWDPDTIEVYTGSPKVFRWSLDKDGRPGRTWVRCPVHAREIKSFEAGKVALCPARGCGRAMLPVWAVRKKNENRNSGNEQYFIKNEVWHDSHYKGREDDTWYGLSPEVSLWNKANTLAAMEQNDLDTFKQLEFPDVIYTVVTDNPIETAKLLDEQRAKQVASGKREPMILWIQPSPMKNNAKYGLQIDSLIAQTFQYQLDRSKELRERMAGLYQVPPLLMGSTEGIGGLNAEDTQRDVMSAGGDSLKNFISKAAAWVYHQLGLKTVHIWFPRAIKDEEEKELRMQGLRLQNLQIVKNLGGHGRINADGDAEIPEQDIGQAMQPPTVPGQPVVTPQAGAASPFPEDKAFDPSQARDEGGQWTDGNGGGSMTAMPRGNKPRRRINMDDAREWARERGFEIGKPEQVGGQTVYSVRRGDGREEKIPAGEIARRMNVGKKEADWIEVFDTIGAETKYVGQRPLQQANKDLYDELMDIYSKKWDELKIPKNYYKDDVKKAVSKQITDIITSMRDHSKASLDKAFWGGIKAIENQDVFAFAPGQRDAQALEAIHTDKDGILEALRNYDQVMREKIFQVIEDHYSKPEAEFTIRAMMDDLKKTGLDLAEHRLENIARTESQHASNLGKLEAWKQLDPEDTFVYEWSNPDDHRTTPICHNLVAKTNRAKGGKPVTMPVLEAMMDEEITAYKAQLRVDHPTWKLDFQRRGLTPWYQCRGTPIRVVI